MTERDQRRIVSWSWRFGPERVRTALHESGHYVVGLHLGWRFHAVSARSNGRLAGRVVVPCNPPRPAHEHRTVDCSGGVAESIAGFADDSPERVVGGMVQDHRDFARRTAEIRAAGGPLGHDPGAESAFDAAREILSASWVAVMRLTEALLTRGTLQASEARHIVRRALGQPVQAKSGKARRHSHGGRRGRRVTEVQVGDVLVRARRRRKA